MEQRSDDVPVGDHWLGAGELTRLASLRFPKRREEWRLGRWTAKHAVSAYLGLNDHAGELSGIEVRASPDGVPETFIAGRPAPVTISLSHRAGIGLCAIAPVATMLGCDLETVEPRIAPFLEDYFTGEEQQWIRHSPDVDRDRLVALCWSAKESVLKALGAGLRRTATDVMVHPAIHASGGIWKTFHAHTVEGGVFQGWYREDGNLIRTIAVSAG